MALLVKAGTFELRATPGAQSVTGIGFKGKAGIFFGTGLPAFDVYAHLEPWLGAAVASDQEWAIALSSRDNVATTDTHRQMDSDGCIMCLTEEGDLDYKANLTSWDDDGFTINVSTASGHIEKIGYIILGGDDLSNAAAGVKQLANSTGNQSVTGLAFQPDIDLLATVGNTALGASNIHLIGSLGWAIDASHQCLTAISAVVGVAHSVTCAYQRTDRCVCQLHNDAISWEAPFVGQTADGFTINLLQAPSTDYIGYLALKGDFQKAILPWTATASSGSDVSQAVTGVGFTPVGMFTQGWCRAASSSVSADLRLSIGAASGASDETAVDVTDQDAQATTNSYRSHAGDRTYVDRGSADGLVDSDFEVTSWGADGVTVNWVTSDGGEDQILSVFLGSAGGAPPAGNPHYYYQLLRKRRAS